MQPCSSQPASLTLQPAGKKKKKKKAKARGDDDFGGLEEGGEEGGERGGGGLPWEGSDRDYTYEELLGEGALLFFIFIFLWYYYFCYVLVHRALKLPAPQSVRRWSTAAPARALPLMPPLATACLPSQGAQPLS